MKITIKSKDRLSGDFISNIVFDAISQATNSKIIIDRDKIRDYDNVHVGDIEIEVNSDNVVCVTDTTDATELITLTGMNQKKLGEIIGYSSGYISRSAKLGNMSDKCKGKIRKVAVHILKLNNIIDN